MGKKKYLRKEQLDVLRDIFSGDFDEQQVLERHGVSSAVYNKWLSDEAFCREFRRRLEASRLRSQALLARYSLMAAAKLIELSASEKGETARKACLDIISLPSSPKGLEKLAAEEVTDEAKPMQLSGTTASRILAVLAEEKSKKE